MKTVYWLGLLLLLAGCDGSSLPPAADPGRARESLQSVLDAWHQGEKVEALQGRSPAIHVNVPEWNSGKQLVKYEIKSEQAAGQSWRCEVLLTVKQGGGPESQYQANFCIDTDPQVVIVREP